MTKFCVEYWFLRRVPPLKTARASARGDLWDEKMAQPLSDKEIRDGRMDLGRYSAFPYSVFLCPK